MKSLMSGDYRRGFEVVLWLGVVMGVILDGFGGVVV